MGRKELRLEIFSDGNIIPSFINEMLVEHYTCFNILSSQIYPSIYRCVEDRFCRMEVIEDIVYDILMSLSEIRDISEDDLYFLTYKYIIKKIKEYELISVNFELYEEADNFSKVADLLLTISNNGKKTKKEIGPKDI